MANEVKKIIYTDNNDAAGDKRNHRELKDIDKIEKITADDLNQIRDVVNSTVDVVNGAAPNLPSNFPVYDDATVKADITTNKNDIATNKNGIAANKREIDQLDGLITNNEDDILEHEPRIAANTRNIATNTQDIVGLKAGGGGGGGGAAYDDRQVKADIKSNTDDIEQNASDIRINKSLVDGVQYNNYYLSYDHFKNGVEYYFAYQGGSRDPLSRRTAKVYNDNRNGTAAEQLAAVRGWIKQVLVFMMKFQCFVLNFEHDEEVKTMLSWLKPGYFNCVGRDGSRVCETVITREGGLSAGGQTIEDPLRLEGDGEITVSEFAYSQTGSDDHSLMTHFTHEQSGDRDQIKLDDFVEKAFDPSRQKVWDFDRTTTTFHRYLRGEITYHHDSAVFRKDQHALLVSSLGQQVNGESGEADRWLNAPGLVNQEYLNGDSFTWDTVNKRTQYLKPGIYHIDFQHNFYDIRTSGETYVKITVNGTKNTDYVLRHFKPLGGHYSQTNSGKNFTYNAGGWIRVLKENRVYLNFRIRHPDNRARTSRYAHGQAITLAEGRDCFLYITRLDSGVEIDPNIPGSLPNES